MTATAIGAHSAMHKTKVSRAVAELEKRKWLTRTPDAADRRVEHLALTKAGAAAYREHGAAGEGVRAPVNCVGEAERQRTSAIAQCRVAALEGALTAPTRSFDASLVCRTIMPPKTSRVASSRLSQRNMAGSNGTPKRRDLVLAGHDASSDGIRTTGMAPLCQHVYQSITTLPELPLFIASKPAV